MAHNPSPAVQANASDRYLVLLEGGGGELDRRTVDTDDADALRDAVLDIATGCTLTPGDVIRIVDTTPDKE